MKLFLATGNPHKLGEFQAILASSGLSVEVLPASAAGGMPEVAEDAGTFAGNARKKARALAAQIRAGQSISGQWCAVADDSGLCVDALGGAPGVISARFAGTGAGDAANTAKLLDGLEDVPPRRRTAAFHCAIVAALADGREILAEGRCPGRISLQPSGELGFGYDPVFVPKGEERSFAELPSERKNTISHRARALAQLVRALAQAAGE